MTMINKRYPAKALVDLALGGHFCINDTVHSAILTIYRLWGAEGRRRMNALPDLTECNRGDDETKQWQEQWLSVLRDAELAAAARRRALEAELEKDQAKFWDA